MASRRQGLHACIGKTCQLNTYQSAAWHTCAFSRSRLLADLSACRGLEASEELKQIKEKVHSFTATFAMPGFDVTDLEPANGKVANGVANGNGNGIANGHANGHATGSH